MGKPKTMCAKIPDRDREPITITSDVDLDIWDTILMVSRSVPKEQDLYTILAPVSNFIREGNSYPDVRNIVIHSLEEVVQELLLKGYSSSAEIVQNAVNHFMIMIHTSQSTSDPLESDPDVI